MVIFHSYVKLPEGRIKYDRQVQQKILHCLHEGCAHMQEKTLERSMHLDFGREKLIP